ncbi:type I polyketide synthase [Brunnivagina elsteri]|uniref:Polyketide synthase n=1 Tax=Brunnivagina elsteri CCALA 953 TaxID=987040 RepID=A0A2A2TQD3_9CYAN|nr:type I polyketide synthase [Calothrix elsteri]PAX60564.1 polyketide synthase [Calothrix elsteri CCALA 953]
MSASWIDTALSQLEDQIKDCEQALLKFIEEKKRMSDKPMSTNKMNRKLQDNPIAIIGMANLFPQARNLREYWENIINKVDCITEIPDSHWNVDDYYDPNPRTKEDKTYCKHGGFIPYVDFNPMEFGLPPNILEVTDVSQLLSLVVAKEAMEDAGYSTTSEFNRENVGVILGVASGKQLAMPLAARLEYPVWQKILKSSGLSDEDTEKIIGKFKSAYVKWDENAFPGMLANVVAGRIANRLNFGGTNCVVDAACASSFAALKMAISELVEHRSDMMLTGGVDTDNSIMAYISFSKTPAVSPGDKVQPFDAKSDGMMLGEGIGMVVLKRLQDAERDGDKIYAVIRGIGTSSDGRYKSIYAPRQEGQVKALQRAYDDAGINPATVGLVEAHGTGTMAGDPTEFASLREFFGDDNARKQYIALGSVKSQIGHTKAAAGSASLIKMALALHHKVLPATINVTEPNPKLNIKNSPFYLNTETRPWIRAENEAPRRAGVSSFGFGGTNFHVILEEHVTPTANTNPYRLHSTPAEILLFADNVTSLQSRCEEVLAKLQSHAGQKDYLELIKECKGNEIPLSAARVGFVAESRVEAAKLLQMTVELLRTKSSLPAWEHPQGIFYRQSGMELGGKVVALFSGQGSQYLEMGRELVMNFPKMQQMFGYMDSLLLKDNCAPLSEVVFPHPVFDEVERNAQIAALQCTEYAQPAIGMLSAGMYKILQQAGFKSDFVAGHSFGELTALWAAGVFSDEDYSLLVKARGQAMSPPQDPDYDAGAMLAVREDLSKVEAAIANYPGVSVANYNSQNQVVLAGPTADIHQARQALQDKGYTAILLPVSAAFHTSLIAFAQKSFTIALRTVNFQTPKVPIYSNVTGNVYPQEPQGIQRILETHLASSVLFKQEIENIYGAGGYCFVEFGPRKVLTNLVKDILGTRPHIAVALNGSSHKNSDRTLREAVVQLRVAGLPLKNLDPYQVPLSLPPTETTKSINIRLNGANYISEKTRKGWTEALEDGYKVSTTEVNAIAEGGALPIAENVAEETRLICNVESEKQLIQTSSMSISANSSPNSSNGHHSNAQVATITTNGVKPDLTSNTTSNIPSTVSGSHPESKPATFTSNHTNGSKNGNSEVKSNLIPNTQINLHNSEPEKSVPPVTQPARQSQMQPTSNNLAYYQRVLESLEYVLAQFQQNQSENLQVHGLYLNHQQEYAQTFFQLMQQQNSLFANFDAANPTKAVVMESLERSMMQFHSQQGETLRVHEQYLQHQVEYTKQFFQVIQQEYAQIISGDSGNAEVEELLTTAPSRQTSDTQSVEKQVDSIPVIRKPATNKVVEILPIIPTPTAIQVPTEVFNHSSSSVQAKSIVQPVIEKTVIGKPVIEQTVIKETVIKEPIVTAITNSPTPTIDLSDLSDRLLAITSEKTGYPVEMLELDMDMEADLGIDSIKRVEILGGLQEIYPELPQPNLEELGEKRTIAQIVEYLQSNNSATPNGSIASVANNADIIPVVTFAATTPLIVEPLIPEVTAAVATLNQPLNLEVEVPTIALAKLTEGIADAQTTTVNVENLDQALLAITSEKTGYPVEMLELDMDMEADLGIDSIKRVEIMGALQEAFPDLPKPDNMEEIAELRTIGQIANYLQNLAGGEKKKLEFDSIDRRTDVSIVDDIDLDVDLDTGIQRLPASLQILNQPDWLDFQPASGYIALITDDGSDTTVEVASGLSEQGWKVVILNFPAIAPNKSTLPAGIERVVLTELSEAHLQTQLNAITTNYGSIGAFIHVHPTFPVPNDNGIYYNPAEKAIVKQVFLIAKHLKKSLNEAASQTRSCFCTVARLDGAFGLAHQIDGQQTKYSAIAAGLFGLSKTMIWEWSNVFCRAIDISPAIDAETSAKHIIAELHDSNRNLTEVAYGTQGRVTLIAK